MPLPKPPTRPGDTIETTALAATPETSPVRAVPGPALDVSLDAPRARGAKTRPVAAILSRSSDRATPEARPAPAAAQSAAPAAKAAPAPADKAPHEGKPAAAPGKAAPAPARPAATRARPKRLPVSQRKLFVLDTNVLLHDSSSLFRFAEHDVFLPMIVLEELDHQKKGMSEVARNARQVSRHLDQLIGTADLSKGVPLDTLGNTDALGSLHFQTRPTDTHLPLELPMGKADNVILGVVHGLCQENPKREVVLVSKDINMRLKARALGLPAEDYLNDHVLDDSDLLYDGVMPLPENFWNKHGKDIESWQQNGLTWYRVRGPLCGQFIVNEFVYYEGEMPLYAQVREVTGKSAVLSTLRDFSHAKNSVWGVTTRNREQNFALNLLMNPDIDFVSLLGQAGTGKTLLAEEVARALDRPLLQWHIKSTTKAQQGLYEYDAVSRLRDSQLGEATVHDIRNYIVRGVLWQAFESERPCVVLIDEIDKADIEFPNDLLQELDRMEFYVYETDQTIKAAQRPIVIITSNNEKELPDAFLRRCFFHYIKFPEEDTMRAIIEVHFPGLKGKLVQEALNIFYEIRDVPGLKKKPSTSELIDWLKLLLSEDISPETLREKDPSKLIPPLHGALLKNEQDVHLFERLAFLARRERN
jgi:PhoH-like ATPase